MLTISRTAMLRLAVAPAALLMMGFFFYPLLRIAGLSVHLPGFSLREYAEAFNPINVGIAIKTFSIAGSVTLACLFLGYALAACLAQTRGRMKQLFTLCIIVPFLTSFLVRSYAWVVLLGDQGALNGALLGLGLIKEPFELLYSRTGMYIGMIHVMLPLMVLPIYAAMQAIDPMLWRAARGLGGGGLRTFLTVYLPQTMPGVRSGCILVFVLSLGFYITPAMLGASRDLMLGNLIATNVETTLNFGFAAALALVLLAATLVVYAFLHFISAGAATTDGSRPAWSRWLDRSGKAIGAQWFGGRTPAVALSGAGWRVNSGRAAGQGKRAGRVVLFSFGFLACVYLVAPSVIVAVVSFNDGDNLAFPPSNWSLRWFRFLFADAQWAAAALTSFKIAATSVVFTLLLGTAAAYGIARMNPRREGRVLYAMALAPMVVPAVVTALGAFAVLSDMGLYGTLTGVIAMHVCLSIPLVIVVMVASFSGFDSRLEMAAQSLGASRTLTFRRVMLPLLAPGLMSAALLAFLHSFDDVVMTSFIAGTKVVTIPLKMWENIRNQVDPAVAALSTLLILLPFVVLLVRRRTQATEDRTSGVEPKAAWVAP
ncbi:ABC transporter permease subunit [Variovorax sp. RT4R15]|uniref:ABC transporter permease subunit n=1 Tax=Variovorax sp. RT4R15 TaxID=3443737 RepID=UPI003F46DA3D